MTRWIRWCVGAKRMSAVLLVGSILGSTSLSGADTREELVKEVEAALTAKDKEALRKCFNFEGTDPKFLDASLALIDGIVSWSTHYVCTTERIDSGKMQKVEDGKTLTHNGEWQFFLNIYLAKPPSTGYVFPAGQANGHVQILGAIEDKP